MKFKIGDKVRLVDILEFSDMESNVEIGDIGIVERYSSLHKYPYYVRWTTLKCDDTVVYNADNCAESELNRLEIPDSKLARNLYKNQIEKIEDGKIHLKG